MNIALFGGTFDPLHRGHLAVAAAAAERFRLARVYFVPAAVSPFKQRIPVTPFPHRYAMLALGTKDDPRFLPSLLEAPRERGARRAPNYTIETVRAVRRMLGKSDRLFLLVGVDAFLALRKWRSPVELLRAVEFIVASRPGYSLADIATALPGQLAPSAAVKRALSGLAAQGTIALAGATIHRLPEVRENVSASSIRAAAARGRPLARWVPAPVADYIRKMGLYRK